MKLTLTALALLISLSAHSNTPLPFPENIIDCQEVTASIFSSTPAAVDGWVDLCAGEELTVNGKGIYPENGTTYNQSDSTSIFNWNFGDGQLASEQDTVHSYDHAGIFYISLEVTDSMGCQSTNLETLKVRVAPLPFADISAFPSDEVCEGTSVELEAGLSGEQVIYPEHTFRNNELFFIPDGNGTSIFDTLNVFGYPGGIIDSPDDIEICINIEHSWMRDIEIKLICPDGQSFILHDHPGSVGGEVFLGIPFENDEGMEEPTPGGGFEYCWSSTPNQPFTWIEFANTFMPPTLPSDSYLPFEDFGNIGGCAIDGNWVLQVTDLWQIDNGVLFDWDIDFGSNLQGTIETDSFLVITNPIGWQPDATIQSSTATAATALPVDTSLYFFNASNSFGCNAETSIEIITIDSTLDECLPCDSIIVNAGEDIMLPCDGPPLLSANNSTLFAHLEIEWTSEDGRIISPANNINVSVDMAGTYVFTAFNPHNGCLLSDTVEVMPTVLPTAFAGDDKVYECYADTVRLNGSGSTIGISVSHAWYAVEGEIVDGQETLFPTVSGTGQYVLVVLDSMTGCTVQDTVFIEFPEPLFAGVNTTPANCDQADGLAEVVPITPADQLTIAWSNGDTGLQTSGLAQGWYSVTVTGNDCTLHRNFYVDEDISCKVRIGGYVLDDTENLDCQSDSTTIGTECIMLHLLPDDIYTYSDSTGYYEFIRDAGDYTIEYVDEDVYDLVCPASGNYFVTLPIDGSASLDNDFYIEQIPVINWCINSSTGIPRPGFNLTVWLRACNYGDVAGDATLTFTHDSLLLDETLSATADTYDPVAHTATWNLSNIPAGECENIVFSLHLPADTPLGTLLAFSTNIEAVLGEDDFPYNNSLEWSRIVVGSFDPNDKTTLTGEDQFGGNIFAEDSIFYYQIRFQNTGTDTAFTVVVRDTLSEHLDVTTIRPGNSSHDYQLQFENNNVLVFFFDNILLPDSTSNEPASNGFITFSIRKKRGLPLGTEIYNSAAIFFDFNQPVITNETVHVLTEPVAIFENIIADNILHISPNPNNGIFTANYYLPEAANISLDIMDASGRLVQQVLQNEYSAAGKHQQGIFINKNNGLYFIIMKKVSGEVIGVRAFLISK